MVPDTPLPSGPRRRLLQRAGTLALVAALSAAPLAAQTVGGPMSAIDWLDRSNPAPPAEPEFDGSGTLPLGRPEGTLPPTAEGLTPTMPESDITRGIGGALQGSPMTLPDATPAPGSELPLGGEEPTLNLIPPGEAPTARSIDTPDVSVIPLDAPRTGAVGLISAERTGLPADLWLASQEPRLVALLRDLTVDDQPAMQSLLYSLLLTESEPPRSSERGLDLLLARIDKLMELGAVDAALALTERAGPESDPQIFARWFDLSLLSGTEEAACASLSLKPELIASYAARIYCSAREGDFETAALTYDSAAALDTLDPAMDRLLRRYLFDDGDDAAPVLPPPAEMSPLAFRLQEAIGEPLPVTGLPRVYASADLRSHTGWRAHLDAAERLARTGALPENQLLGIWSDQKPAASGGIWDRVAALQAFDTALSAGNRDAALEALPAAWKAMQDAQLEIPFARLYAEKLAPLAPVDGPAHDIFFSVVTLGPGAEDRADALGVADARQRFLRALVAGTPGTAPAPDALAEAIAEGFAPDHELPLRLRDLIEQNRTGEALLVAMQLNARAAAGEYKDLPDALATFRRLGLEDTARRSGLELMLLERRP